MKGTRPMMDKWIYGELHLSLKIPTRVRVVGVNFSPSSERI